MCSVCMVLAKVETPHPMLNLGRNFVLQSSIRTEHLDRIS